MSNDKMDTIIELLKVMRDLLTDYGSTLDAVYKHVLKLEEKLSKAKSPGEILEDTLSVEDIKKKLNDIDAKIEKIRKSLYWHRVSTEKNQFKTGRKGYKSYKSKRGSER